MPPRRLEHPYSLGAAERLQAPERRPGDCSGTSALTQAALRERRLALYAQPVVDLSTRAVVAHELLLAISPSRKEPSWDGGCDRAAERPPAAIDPDIWVVARAAWFAAAGREAHISVCASSLRAPQFPRLVGRALRRAGGDPHNVTLAIDEDVLTRTFANGFASHAARLGVRLAVNNFALRFDTGDQLDALRVEDVKLDPWLVARVADHAPSAATVARIVELARASGRRTIALDPPGPRTLDALRELGVDCAQGFDLLGPPRAADRTP